MRTELIKLRVKFLKDFDRYVRDEIGDEDIMDYWLERGVPDESDDEMLFEIASDDELWVGIVDAFYYCVRAENDEED